jgi:hypothetical protein
MIRFSIDGIEDYSGYELRAHVGGSADDEITIKSAPLYDERQIAIQARELADAAASLLETLPEHAEAFELLHDVIDRLPQEVPT